MTNPQSFKHHTRWVTHYHFVLSGIFLVNLIYRVYMVIRYPAVDSLVSALTAYGLVLAFLFIRTFPLRVQDRLIRLEERLRMHQLFPADLQPRIGELTPAQMVALRFASDGELPGLARRVLDEKITRKRDIKALIQTWRPDEYRM